MYDRETQWLSSGSGGGGVEMAGKGGRRIDFMFLGPPLTRPLDPLLWLFVTGGLSMGGLREFTLLDFVLLRLIYAR